jgi:prephenate dehydrogenase
MASSALVIQENPDLYYSIQRLNPFTPQLYETLEHELSSLTHAVLHSDRRSFIELMSQGKLWLTGAGD